MNLNLRTIDYSGSIVDGPGLRTVLFVQGCKRRCAGCHNPATWALDGGVVVTVADLAEELRDKVPNKKITISGGEPLLQTTAIIALLKELPDFNAAMYTGGELHEVPEDLLGCLDYIKVGRFEAEKRTTASPYVGSSNQQFLQLRRGES